jgi:hypothetical protein
VSASVAALSTWTELAEHLARRHRLTAAGEEHLRLEVVGPIGARVNVDVALRGGWLELSGSIGSARGRSPAPWLADNGDQPIGARLVTRAGELRIRQVLWLGGFDADDLEHTLSALAAAITRGR